MFDQAPDRTLEEWSNGLRRNDYTDTVLDHGHLFGYALRGTQCAAKTEWRKRVQKLPSIREESEKESQAENVRYEQSWIPIPSVPGIHKRRRYRPAKYNSMPPSNDDMKLELAPEAFTPCPLRREISSCSDETTSSTYSTKYYGEYVEPILPCSQTKTRETDDSREILLEFTSQAIQGTMLDNGNEAGFHSGPRMDNIESHRTERPCKPENGLYKEDPSHPTLCSDSPSRLDKVLGALEENLSDQELKRLVSVLGPKIHMWPVLQERIAVQGASETMNTTSDGSTELPGNECKESRDAQVSFFESSSDNADREQKISRIVRRLAESFRKRHAKNRGPDAEKPDDTHCMNRQVVFNSGEYHNPFSKLHFDIEEMEPEASESEDGSGHYTKPDVGTWLPSSTGSNYGATTYEQPNEQQPRDYDFWDSESRYLETRGGYDRADQEDWWSTSGENGSSCGAVTEEEDEDYCCARACRWCCESDNGGGVKLPL